MRSSATLASPALPGVTVVAVMISESGSTAAFPAHYLTNTEALKGDLSAHTALWCWIPALDTRAGESSMRRDR